MDFETLRINELYRVVRYADITKRWHAQNRGDHFIGIKLRGQAMHHFRHGDVLLSPGSLYFFNRKDDYDVQILEPGEALSAHFTTFSPIETDSFCISSADCGKFAMLLEKLEALQSDALQDPLSSLSLFYALCAELNRLRQRQETSSHPKIHKAHEYLRTHFHEQEALVNAVKICGISERWFRELFSAAFGTTPGRYLSLRRIEYAKELLRSGSYSIAETSAMCGFRDVYYFSKCFKNETGISPGAYKKRPQYM